MDWKQNPTNVPFLKVKIIIYDQPLFETFTLN